MEADERRSGVPAGDAAGITRIKEEIRIVSREYNNNCGSQGEGSLLPWLRGGGHVRQRAAPSEGPGPDSG